MLETPLGITTITVGILIPLLALCTVFLRAAWVYYAAKVACTDACRAARFQGTTSTKTSSAKFIAVKRAVEIGQGVVDGVHFKADDVTVLIKGKPVKPDQKPILQGKPLESIDTSSFVYMTSVDIKAKVDPLFKVDPKIGGNIPGWSAPLVLTATACDYVEKPEGLLN